MRDVCVCVCVYREVEFEGGLFYLLYCLFVCFKCVFWAQRIQCVHWPHTALITVGEMKDWKCLYVFHVFIWYTLYFIITQGIMWEHQVSSQKERSKRQFNPHIRLCEKVWWNQRTFNCIDKRVKSKIFLYRKPRWWLTENGLYARHTKIHGYILPIRWT